MWDEVERLLDDDNDYEAGTYRDLIGEMYEYIIELQEALDATEE